MKKMSNFGKHDQAVHEVLDFINSGKILFVGKLPEGIDAVVIHDLDKIPSEEFYEKFEDERPVWRDIIGQAASVFFCKKVDLTFSLNHFLSNLVMELENEYAKTLLRGYRKVYLDKEIPGLLGYIVQCRVIMGKENKFFETLFEILKSGGYPCGWEGHYPDGKLIVFYPPK